MTERKSWLEGSMIEETNQVLEYLIAPECWCKLQTRTAQFQRHVRFRRHALSSYSILQKSRSLLSSSTPIEYRRFNRRSNVICSTFVTPTPIYLLLFPSQLRLIIDIHPAGHLPRTDCDALAFERWPLWTFLMPILNVFRKTHNCNRCTSCNF